MRRKLTLGIARQAATLTVVLAISRVAVAIDPFVPAAPVYAGSVYTAPAYAAPGYTVQPYVAGYRGALAPAPTNRFYNPVGFGFGGYSYGSYPAYGYNGYLPAAYEGFNTPTYYGATVTGFRGAAPVGGTTSFPMSQAWIGTCGPGGCQLQYRPQQ